MCSLSFVSFVYFYIHWHARIFIFHAEKILCDFFCSNSAHKVLATQPDSRTTMRLLPAPLDDQEDDDGNI